MSLFSWLHQPMTGRRQTRSTPARKPTPRFRPQLETLERRDVPSTLTVTSNLDSGAGSLRADIAAANPGDTINFAPSLNGQTIKLTSGELVINKSLTIQGPGAGLLAIDGGVTWYGSGLFRRPTGGNSRLFEVGVYGVNTNVTISGLTLTDGNSRGSDPSGNGLSGNGGAILNCYGSTLTVSGCTLSNDYAALNGGGIANEMGATLNVVNSNLSGNQARGSNGDGPDGEGGAVYNGGVGSTLSMTGCTLSNNSASLAGGGIYLLCPNVTISGCTFSGNLERYDGNDIFQWSSNGSYPGRFTLNDSVFSNNTAYHFDPIVGWWKGSGNTFN